VAGRSLFAKRPAVFAVFAGKYQRQVAPSPQESKASDEKANGRTAGYTAGAGSLGSSLTKIQKAGKSMARSAASR
jgi:hypothetical protein